MTINAAPSQENTLFCDVPGCEAALSMVAGVPRSEHGWGRVSVYSDVSVVDYDLCAEHRRAVIEILQGTPVR